MKLDWTTPAKAAGLDGEFDQDQPRIGRWTALGMIAGIYSLFFALGIATGIYGAINGPSGVPLDYGSPRMVQFLAQSVGEIAGVLAIFFLVRQWLKVSPALAGIPGRRAPATPALLTAYCSVVGLFAATIVSTFIGSDENTNGTSVVNAFFGLSAVRSLNAGIVEEIVIVAIPVLIGRRAGWNPLIVAGLSVLLRWPFHVYHGVLETIPWVIVWAGVNVGAYLVWRRLWPLVVVHAMYDFRSITLIPLGDGAVMLGLLAIFGMVFYLMVRLVIDRRKLVRTPIHQLPADVRRYVTGWGTAARLSQSVFPVVAVLLSLAIGIFSTLDTGSLAIGVILGLVFGVILLGCNWIAYQLSQTVDVLPQYAGGTIIGAIVYRREYTGDLRIVSTMHQSRNIASLAALIDAERNDAADRALLYRSGHKSPLAKELTAAGFTSKRRYRWMGYETRIPLTQNAFQNT